MSSVLGRAESSSVVISWSSILWDWKKNVRLSIMVIVSAGAPRAATTFSDASAPA